MPEPRPAPNPNKVNDHHSSHQLQAKEQMIVDILRKNPGLSNLGIQKELNRLGEKTGINYVYRRLSKSELLRKELSEIRSHANNFIDRELVPAALKIHAKVLKSKKIEDLKKKDWVFKAEDLGFKLDDSKRPKQQQNINIKQLQVLVKDGLST